MNYYILQNDEIVLFDSDKKRLQDTLLFKPDLADAKIHQTTKEIVELDRKFVFADEHTDELIKKAKSEKLLELTAITSKFDDQLVNTDMIIKSSLGFSINADLRSQNNLRGLIAVGVEPVNFVTADNSVKSLSIAELNTLLNECALNGQSLYLKKWEYKAKIESAQTIAELEKIDFNFVMLDFSEVK